MSKLGWFLWVFVLVIAVVLAFVLPLSRGAAFYVALLGMLLSFVLSAIAFRKGKDAKSTLMGLLLWQLAVGTLVIQLVIAFILMAISGCPWLVAAIVEGLVLCVDAFALTEQSGDSTSEP